MSQHPYPNRHHQRSWSDRSDNRRREFHNSQARNNSQPLNRDMFFGISRQNFQPPQQQYPPYRTNSFGPQQTNNNFGKTRGWQKNVKRRHSANAQSNNRNFGNNFQRPMQPSSSQVSTSDCNVSQRILHHAEKKQRLEEKKEERNKLKNFLITANEILFFKEEVNNCITATYLEELCARKARYTYFVDVNGHSKAMELSTRKKPEASSMKCITCDRYSTSEVVHQMHMNSPMHHEINSIFLQLKKLANDWIEEKNNTNYVLKAFTRNAERDGILVSSQDNTLRDEQFETDDWLFEIDQSNIDAEKFVLEALEIRMKSIWPQPKSNYFCRSCNYAEYSSSELLERHMKSARHLDFQRHYKEAFCITCQVHNGDDEGMRKHMTSCRHKQIYDIMEETKMHALSFWNRKYENSNFHDNKLSQQRFDERISPINRDEKSPVKEINKQYEETHDNVSLKKPCPALNVFSKASPPQNIGIVNPMVTSTPPVVVNPMVTSMPPVVAAVTPIVTTQSCVETDDNPLDNKVDIIPDTNPSAVKLTTPPTESFDGKENVSTKSKLPEFLDNRKKDEEINEKEEVKSEEKVNINKFDDFIVPLTGYMCTICHQTLDNDDEATTHMYGYQHRKNKEYQAHKF